MTTDFSPDINDYINAFLNLRKNQTPELTPSTENTSGNAAESLNSQQEDSNQHRKKKTPSKRSAKNLPDFSVMDRMRKNFDTSTPIPKTEFIGGLFPRGYVSLLVAPPGTGKSLAIQKIFTDLSNGGDFLQHYTKEDDEKEYRCFAKNEPARKCIILAGELGERGLRERAQEFKFEHKTENVEVFDQVKYDEAGFSFTIDSKEGQACLEHIAMSKPDILFIDSFSAFFDGKENDNSEVRNAFRFLCTLARRHDIALVVSHHSRKRLSSEQDKPLTLDDVIGGNAITRFVHTVIALEYDKKREIRCFTCLKSWSKKFKPFGYYIRKSFYGEPYIDINLDPGELNEDNLNLKTSNINQNPEWQIRLEGFLLGKGEQGATRQEIFQALRIESIEYGEYDKKLKRILEKGYLQKLARGRYALPKDKLIKPDDNQLSIFEDGN